MLAEGDSIQGPLIIYEEGATTVLPPGASGRVGTNECLFIDVSG